VIQFKVIVRVNQAGVDCQTARVDAFLRAGGILWR
jgi:hypothetical protein